MNHQTLGRQAIRQRPERRIRHGGRILDHQKPATDRRPTRSARGRHSGRPPDKWRCRRTTPAGGVRPASRRPGPDRSGAAAPQASRRPGERQIERAVDGRYRPVRSGPQCHVDRNPPGRLPHPHRQRGLVPSEPSGLASTCPVSVVSVATSSWRPVRAATSRAPISSSTFEEAGGVPTRMPPRRARTTTRQRRERAARPA